ncbi:MAG: Asp-tRNA(Asn)/Glu-tRNA(Gln) amidotransferase subunit GatC [Flavobacteriales bacterium]
MKIDLKTIEHLAHLSKLEFSEDEKQTMLQDFENMLGFVSKLEEIDLSGVEPKIYVNDETNYLREDVENQSITREEALKNAPQKDDYYIRVPKVIKQ